LYEYQCAHCGRFEIIQKFSDEPLSSCPKCGREVHKLLSAPAIQFKGTGWYITDYARKAPAKAGAVKDAAAKGDAGSAASSSSKDSESRDSGTPTTTTSKEGSATGSSPTK
jgi:putative FmdB family regulatory protein